MRVGELCSGISAAAVAGKDLGLEHAFFAETDPYASAVLQQRHPGVKNLGDITDPTFAERAHARGPIDLLIAGTPCQSFSTAGRRGGMDDARGRLALHLPLLAHGLRPRWIVWENVAGVLSSAKGRDFGAFLTALAELGYGLSWRVLDARYFGVAQRRRRVFVVGHLGDWTPAAAVLLEPEGLSGAGEAREPQEEDAPRDHAPCAPGSVPETAGTLTIGGHGGAYNGQDAYSGNLLPVAFDIAQITHPDNGSIVEAGRECPTIAVHSRPCVAVGVDLYNQQTTGDLHAPLRTAGGHGAPAVLQGYRIRIFTPLERERLMGFPDGYTAVRWKGRPAEEAPDTPRFKVLGNSIVVPVMRWLIRRLVVVDAMLGRA